MLVVLHTLQYSRVGLLQVVCELVLDLELHIALVVQVDDHCDDLHGVHTRSNSSDDDDVMTVCYDLHLVDVDVDRIVND